jgi:putative SOS response-associated peptidase YedK
LADIHDRAPVVLPREAYDAWLDRRITDPKRVEQIAGQRVPPAELTQWKVRLLVNNAKSDGPELMEPLEASTSAG